MQSNPRILVNLLVISVKIPVSLLVKLTKLGGARPGAPPQRGERYEGPADATGGHEVCCSSPTYSPDSLANSLADSLANITSSLTNSKCIVPAFYRSLPAFTDVFGLSCEVLFTRRVCSPG